MALDADILAADAATLEKIKAQEYRNDLADLKAHRAAVRAATAAHQAACAEAQAAALAWQKEQYSLLPPELTPQQTLRIRLGEAIADKYFTTSSNTTATGWASDAAQDAGKFGAALDAAVAEVLRA
jgi:hypothetical protein